MQIIDDDDNFFIIPSVIYKNDEYDFISILKEIKIIKEVVDKLNKYIIINNDLNNRIKNENTL